MKRTYSCPFVVKNTNRSWRSSDRTRSESTAPEDTDTELQNREWTPMNTNADPGAALVKRGSSSTAPKDTDTELQNREWTPMNTDEEDLFVSIRG